MSRLQQGNIRIKTIREDLGYTQEQFAEFFELSLSGYKKLESGEVHLTLDKVYMLNDKLGLSADYVLFGEKETLSNVWIEICKLPAVEKWQTLMRLYVYLAKRTDNEQVLKEVMESVDEVVNDYFERKKDVK